MSHSIVIGLGFGDEGKGITTSYLCKKLEGTKIVVRFNGGHQAGHTVVFNGKRHIFSSWGSGTLQGMPTYWSEHCTFYPTAFLNERDELISKVHTLPNFYIHPLSPVTTPYDVVANQRSADKNGHGSVGVGFGTTIKRQEDFYKLHVQDLFYESVFRAKLDNIAKYYGIDIEEEVIESFIIDCKNCSRFIKLSDYKELKNYAHVIYEGAQGVLLDQDMGFFPNVTRSNTTCKNALEIVNRFSAMCDIWYVTRTYQTRHGNGFMTNENEPLELVNNENETNVQHRFQGKFRTSKLDPELIDYALRSDSIYHSNPKMLIFKNLFITCNDQCKFPLTITDDTKYEHLSNFKIKELQTDITFKQLMLSHSDDLSKCVDGRSLTNN